MKRLCTSKRVCLALLPCPHRSKPAHPVERLQKDPSLLFNAIALLSRSFSRFSRQPRNLNERDILSLALCPGNKYSLRSLNSLNHSKRRLVSVKPLEWGKRKDRRKGRRESWSCLLIPSEYKKLLELW